MEKLYLLPDFLKSRVTQYQYERWLRRKAAAHLIRDRKRVSHEISGAEYRRLMHTAVCQSEGKDFYTGESLAWEKISTYSNEESRADRSKYKAGFAMLPTVDHVLGEDGVYDFVVCGWRTNDVKSDLSYQEFIEVCRLVVVHYERGGRQLDPGSSPG